MTTSPRITVNRAPVLTLWAAIVAERLRHDADIAITLGRTVAGSSARVKARSLGIEDDKPEGERKAAPKPKPEHETVRLLGRGVPVVKVKGHVRALAGGKATAAPLTLETVLEPHGSAAGAPRRD